MNVLMRLTAEQEKVKAGVVTEGELKLAENRHKSYAGTVNAYVAMMSARGCTPQTCKERKRCLVTAGADALAWNTLADMNRTEIEGWLARMAVTPKESGKPKSVMGARVHNSYVTAFKAFGAYCVRQGLIPANPFTGTVKRDERADRRHIRRALSQEELARLIEAARTRPLQDALKGNTGRGKKMTKEAAALTEKTEDKLRFLGWTRALAYWTAAATGLRWGELRSITLGALRLDEKPPHLILAAKDEKARKGASIPLPEDVAAQLAVYALERLRRLEISANVPAGHAGPLLQEAPLFDVPAQMSKVFSDDLAAAGIPKRDGVGHVVDVHALRHTFGTNLAKAGVPLQVAQKAMRHSTPALTSNVYTHLGLSDVAEATGKLPRIPVNFGAEVFAPHTLPQKTVAPNVAPTPEKTRDFGSISENSGPVSCFMSTFMSVHNLLNEFNDFRAAKGKRNGGRCRARTCDPLRVRQML